MNQIDESAGALVQKPIVPESSATPPLRRVVRKLSEPAHKSSVPIKPILKSKGSGADATSATNFRGLHTSTGKNNVPLRFVTRKAPPTVDTTRAQAEVVPGSPASLVTDEELFYTPGSVKDDYGASADRDYLTSRQKDVVRADRQSENFYKEPPTPLPTPTLRTSFSQDAPYQGYPLTPHNTFRGKRRTPPIVDELDQKRNSGQFPSRPSFTFSPPIETPSPSEFPLPPSLPNANRTQTNGPKTDYSSRRLSWHPTFRRRSQLREAPERPEPTRLSSKRKNDPEEELSTKRRKVVKFDIPAERKQHPPMKRRPTPYYEPLSSKVRRFFRSLFAPFSKTKEEKEAKKAQKEMKKAAKRARKEREELEYSFRNFDDTAD